MKVHTRLNMERPQALKDRHRNTRKKIRRYSHFPKRSAVILTFQKDPPLSHKGVEVKLSGLLKRDHPRLV